MNRSLNYSEFWFPREQFEVRVSNELYHSRRYGTPTSILSVELVQRSVRAAFALRRFVSTDLRRLDKAATVSDGEWAICLPQTDHLSALHVAARLAAALEAFEPIIGVATYPGDADDACSLLRAAKEHGLRSGSFRQARAS